MPPRVLPCMVIHHQQRHQRADVENKELLKHFVCHPQILCSRWRNPLGMAAYWGIWQKATLDTIWAGSTSCSPLRHLSQTSALFMQRPPGRGCLPPPQYP